MSAPCDSVMAPRLVGSQLAGIDTVFAQLLGQAFHAGLDGLLFLPFLFGALLLLPGAFLFLLGTLPLQAFQAGLKRLLFLPFLFGALLFLLGTLPFLLGTLPFLLGTLPFLGNAFVSGGQ